MSAYHRKIKTGRTDRKEDATKTPISREVALSLEAIRQRVKDGLLALCVEVGLNTLEMMFEEELEEKIGKKGKHSAERSSYRHSHEPRKVVLGGVRSRCQSRGPARSTAKRLRSGRMRRSRVVRSWRAMHLRRCCMVYRRVTMPLGLSMWVR
ncbi:MAG: hypothetical protein QME92_05485 [Bacillota bacterium]|nr:hypothetical protein [Bacillota bacterium]